MEIIQNIALISINETLIVQLVSFLLFLYLINRFMIRPLRGVMGQREDYIENIRLDMIAAEKQFDEVTRQIRRKEKEVLAAAQSIRDELEAAGKEEAQSLMSETLREIDRMRRNRDEQIQSAMREARKSVGTEAEALSVSLMEKLLDRRLGK